MTDLIKHPEFGTIRTQIIAGEPWFCAKDVCRALAHSNHLVAIKQHCKPMGVTKRYTPTESGAQEVNFINEGNLYRLIIKSQLPSAEKFESWVCDDVLPSIRRTGEYRIAPMGRKKQISINMEVTQMLWLIDENLMYGDKNEIALLLGVSRQSVCNVLNGHHRSARILMALYKRALENRKNSLKNPYSQDFIASATEKLM